MMNNDTETNGEAVESRIIDRIIQKTGSPEIMEILVDRLSPTDLQSLLLAVYRTKSARLSPGRLLDQYNSNRFVRPSSVDPQNLLALDQLAYSLLPPGFETVEISPVCPLGTVSIMTHVDQNNVLTTIRNTEVCSDSTNVLALECANRRRRTLSSGHPTRSRIKLCASHRLLRTQVFDEPGAVPHFRLFGLVTSGRDEGAFTFETETLLEQIDFYIRLLRESEKLGLVFKEKRFVVIMLENEYIEEVEAAVLDVLRENYPDTALRIEYDPEAGRGYYSRVRFQGFAKDTSSSDLLLVDGGFTTWIGTLLSDRKERLLTSGIGTERLFLRYVP